MAKDNGIIVQRGTFEEPTLKELQTNMIIVLEKLDEIEKKIEAMA